MVWSNKTVRKKHQTPDWETKVLLKGLQPDTPARLANTEEPCCSGHNLP